MSASAAAYHAGSDGGAASGCAKGIHGQAMQVDARYDTATSRCSAVHRHGAGEVHINYRPSSCATLRGTLEEELILQTHPMIRAASMSSNAWRMHKNTAERNPYHYAMGHYRHTPPAGAEGGPGPAQRGGRRVRGHSSREVRSRERSRGAPTEPTRRRRGPRAPPAGRPADGRRRAAEGAHSLAERRPRRRGPVASVSNMGTCNGHHHKILLWPL